MAKWPSHNNSIPATLFGLHLMSLRYNEHAYPYASKSTHTRAYKRTYNTCTSHTHAFYDEQEKQTECGENCQQLLVNKVWLYSTSYTHRTKSLIDWMEPNWSSKIKEKDTKNDSLCGYLHLILHIERIKLQVKVVAVWNCTGFSFVRQIKIGLALISVNHMLFWKTKKHKTAASFT